MVPAHPRLSSPAVSAPSLWARFSDIDADSRPDELLAHLDDLAGLAPMREAKRRATDALELEPGDRVLDVGCGTGVDIPDMLERLRPTGHVTGIDVSSRAVEAAKERLAGISDVSLVVADVQSLPFPDRSFDACRADRTLQHVPSLPDALAEMRRVLVPDGRLVVLETMAELQAPSACLQHPVATSLGAVQQTREERRGWLAYMLPLLVSQAGYRIVRFDVDERASHDFHEVDVAFRLRESIERAIGAGAVTAANAKEWLDELGEAAAAEQVAVSLRSILLVARLAED